MRRQIHVIQFGNLRARGAFVLVLLALLPVVVEAHFKFVTNNGAIVITGYTGPGGSVSIPDSTNGLPVTSIGDSAFHSYPVPHAITSATIPEGVTNIGSFAFDYCTNLASVVIPDSVTRIRTGAFGYCYSLTQVTIPDGVKQVQRSTFYNCTALTNVIVGSGVTNLQLGPFSYCTNLTGVFFRGNAPKLDPDAFYGDNKAIVYYLPGTSGWSNSFDGRPTALWLPQILTADHGFGIRTGLFGFNISWARGRTVALEACTDIAAPTWTPLQTNLLTTDAWYFSDPHWTNHPNRLYRVRWP